MAFKAAQKCTFSSQQHPAMQVQREFFTDAYSMDYGKEQVKCQNNEEYSDNIHLAVASPFLLFNKALLKK